MSLRLRRGTDAERQLLTPLEGELIYVTDSQKLFVGDGTTIGGVPVSDSGGINVTFLGELLDVDLITSPPNTGEVLVYSGSEWVPGTVAADGSGILEGSNYRINIIGDDSTIIVDSFTGTVSADLIGNVTGDVTGSLTGDVVGSVFADDSGILVDALSRTFTGNVIGDVTGNVIGGDISGNFFGIFEGTQFGTSVGEFQGDHFGDHFGEHIGTLRGEDSTLRFDGIDTFTGFLNGDVTGSVLSEDSTVLVDSTSAKLSDGIISIENGTIKSLLLDTGSLDSAIFIGNENDNQSVVIYGQKRNIENRVVKQGPSSYEYVFATYTSQGSHSEPTAVGNNEQVGGILFNAHNGSQYDTVGGIEVYTNGTVDETAIQSYVSINVGNLDLNPAGIKFYEFLDDGGFKMPLLSTPPSNPEIGAMYLADGSGWDPGSIGTVHLALWDGSTFRSF